MFDDTVDFGDSFDAQEEIAEITKTSNLAKCSINNLKQCDNDRRFVQEYDTSSRKVYAPVKVNPNLRSCPSPLHSRRVFKKNA